MFISVVDGACRIVVPNEFHEIGLSYVMEMVVV
jgi:hypothetical protein